MKIDEFSLAFNCPGCPSWGTAVVEQDNQLKHLIKVESAGNIILGMVHKQVPINTHDFSLPLGKGAKVYYGDTGFDDAPTEPILVSVFNKVVINDKPIDRPFILVLIKDRAEDHKGRLQLKYSPKICYGNISNNAFFERVRDILGMSDSTPYMIYDIDVEDQETLIMHAFHGNSQDDIRDEIDAFLANKINSNKKTRVGIVNEVTPLTEDELVNILNSWFKENGPNAIRIFGIKYGAYFADNNISAHKIISRCADVNASYETELSKGIQIYKSIKSGEFGLYFYDNFHKIKYHEHKNLPLQLIYFGAPGTSKSATIKDRIANSPQHRITFHPDTDYSNFVGCYKPTKEEDSNIITYKFVAQTFINAYVEAWENLVDDNIDTDNKKVFLVIEEINRGNCAQIFGDLFQLLDRNKYGFSDYTIEPDADLKRYLGETFRECTNLPEEIRSGSILRLPPNLHIWATMNTSDQSLFPIDSAFKRRWDWKYVPIKDDRKGHTIALKDRQYDWWKFLEAVNSRIEKVTESEDKQLGYWFAQPDNGKAISAEKFVSKVVFYLWNDVFKDYGHDANSPFTIKQDDGKKVELRFKSFFDKDGNLDEKVLILFFWGLKLETKAAAIQDNDASVETESTPEMGEEPDDYQPQTFSFDNNDASSLSRNTPDNYTEDNEEEMPEATSIDDFFK